MARFKYRDGVLPNAVAIAHATAGHAAAIALLTSPDAIVAAAGVLLAAHTLMIATYLLHEAMHETIFADHEANRVLGTALSVLTGGWWAGYGPLRTKHLRHHADRVDPVTFDVLDFLAAAPRPLRAAIVALEWLHLPAIDVVLRAELALRPFRDPRRRAGRPAMLATMTASAAWWAGLCWLGVGVAVLYAVAWLLFLVGMRLFDAFHHTFDLVVFPDVEAPWTPPPAHDRAWEHANTFSNVIVPGRPWTNLVVLNFAYHNAHHAKPGVPWHRLPALDRRLFPTARAHERGIAMHLADFHRGRLARLRTQPPGAPLGVGAVAVSLLTL